jgi:deoxyribodipyrimidine photo-lyase
MDKTYPVGLMWFRRDLRAHDNAALFRVLQACREVHCAFIFDRAILDPLPRRDRRVEFIRESLVELDQDLRDCAQRPGAGLMVGHGMAADEIPRLARELGVHAVFTNHDYEPQAIARDDAVREALRRDGIAFHTFKDQAIFERREVLTRTGTPYSVFTPYKAAWLAALDDSDLKPYPVQAAAAALAELPAPLRRPPPTLGALGFEPSNFRDLGIPAGSSGGRRLFDEFTRRVADYHRTRDFPAIKGPSYLGVHLRFGTVSIRELARRAHSWAQAGNAGAATWLSELIWRDFYFQVLANFPHVAALDGTGHSFKPAYDAIEWEEGTRAEMLFAAWSEGRTGYPLVDAAMAQINQTGYMHNRLRMVVASFLTKDLGIDWRRGERYFARQLNDYDLAANNGGWQWAASSGCDAQPYFRIFNPVSQSRRFDPEGKFIVRYLPQLAALPPRALHEPWTAGPLERAAAGVQLGANYPAPIVQHDEARRRTLQRYAVVRKSAD